MFPRIIYAETGAFIDLGSPEQFERGERQRAKRVAHGNETSVAHDDGRMLVDPTGTATREQDAGLTTATFEHYQPVARSRSVSSSINVILMHIRADVVGRSGGVYRLVYQLDRVRPVVEEPLRSEHTHRAWAPCGPSTVTLREEDRSRRHRERHSNPTCGRAQAPGSSLDRTMGPEGPSQGMRLATTGVPSSVTPRGLSTTGSSGARPERTSVVVPSSSPTVTSTERMRPSRTT